MNIAVPNCKQTLCSHNTVQKYVGCRNKYKVFKMDDNIQITIFLKQSLMDPNNVHIQ